MRFASDLPPQSVCVCVKSNPAVDRMATTTVERIEVLESFVGVHWNIVSELLACDL